MAEGDITVGEVLAEIRDLLIQIATPPPAAEPLSVVPRPKVTGWKIDELTLTTTEMKTIVFASAATGAKLSPVCVVVRTKKASNIDVCLTPMNPQDNPIIVPGTTMDDGYFVHWFPYGVYTIGTSGGKRKFYVQGQGIAEAGSAIAVIMYEETR